MIKQTGDRKYGFNKEENNNNINNSNSELKYGWSRYRNSDKNKSNIRNKDRTWRLKCRIRNSIKLNRIERIWIIGTIRVVVNGNTIVRLIEIQIINKNKFSYSGCS